MRQALFLFFSFCVFVGIGTVFMLSPIQAHAQQTRYARVLSSDVTFFRTPEEPLFLLPLGYYVTVTGEDDEFYTVLYQSGAEGFAALTGFVIKEEVALQEELPESPLHPHVLVTVTSSYTFIYSTPSSVGNTEIALNSGFTLHWYGVKKAVDNTTWYFVKYQSFLGFVPASAVSVPLVPDHPTPLPLPPPPPEPPSELIQNTGGTAVSKWILIAGISVPALIIVALLFRPAKRNQPPTRIPSFMEEFDDLDGI